MKKLLIFRLFDYVLFFCVLTLVIVGIFFIYSSSVNSEGVSVSNEYVRQIVFASAGLVIMMTCAIFDYRKFIRFVPPFYLLFLVVLIYTLFFGRVVNGARSWLGFGGFGIQPSELGKIIYILFLAWYLDRSQKTAPAKRFFIAAIIMGVPLGLILIQPDMGTSSVYVPIFLAMIFAAGIPLKYIFLVLCTGVFSIFFTVLPILNEEIFNNTIPLAQVFVDARLRLVVIVALATVALISLIGLMIYKNKYYYWVSYIFGILTVSLIASIFGAMILQDYQIMRLIVFLNPDIDPLGAGWNIIQSKIAIGSGGLFGQGFLQGTQSHYRFLPQQSTDFIFSIMAEEIGFLGIFFVFSVYGVLFFRILYIMKNAKNTFGYYIVVGILAMFFFHFWVNVGVAMGVMPITGIPLFFLSYGGSSLWTAMIAVGLLKNVYYRRLDYS